MMHGPLNIRLQFFVCTEDFVQALGAKSRYLAPVISR